MAPAVVFNRRRQKLGPGRQQDEVGGALAVAIAAALTAQTPGGEGAVRFLIGAYVVVDNRDAHTDDLAFDEIVLDAIVGRP